jgi:membrane protease subunit (stomatin/prohibitin family)
MPCRQEEKIMGIWDFVKSELIDVIEWIDDSGDIIVWRFPDQDHEIKMGAKLTVREGQAAVFVNEGQIADVFWPGLYTLSTQNMPVMTTLRSWKYGFESPFKAEVYYVSTRNFLDLKWGTQNPIMMRDQDFGVVRLRAFGTYGIRVTDPAVFMKEVFGTEGAFTTEEIEGQLRSMLVSTFTGMLGKSGIAALDLAANYRSIGETARKEMEPAFQKYGLALTLFLIENISVPPEVEKMMDVRAQMGVVGDMGRYTQFQTAQAIPEAARSGGGAGDFMGMGAGIALGQQMAGAMASGLTQSQQAQPSPAQPSERPSGGRFCSQCGQTIPADAKFCPECGTPQQTGCPQCGTSNPPGAKFCQECGSKLT